MTTIQKQYTPGSYNDFFFAQVNLLSFGTFFMIVASIVLPQYFLQKTWKCADLKTVTSQVGH